MQALTQELKDYYEDRTDMCASKGWKDLMEDVQNMYQAYNDISNIESTENFWKRKGYVEMLHWLLNLQKVSETTYEDLLNEETVRV